MISIQIIICQLEARLSFKSYGSSLPEPLISINALSAKFYTISHCTAKFTTTGLVVLVVLPLGRRGLLGLRLSYQEP